MYRSPFKTTSTETCSFKKKGGWAAGYHTGVHSNQYNCSGQGGFCYMPTFWNSAPQYEDEDRLNCLCCPLCRPHKGGKTWTNGSTKETVYADTAKKTTVGSLSPKEKCTCLGKIDGMYLVLYKIDGTTNYKCGFVAYAGGL
mgnify:CR=1 FL=1